MTTREYIRLAKASYSITDPMGDQYENQQSFKEEWLKAGRRILRQLAKELGLGKGSFDIRINKGGIAVSGDVTLHGEWIYVNLAQTSLGPEWGFMWRLCKGRKDYSGGANQWMKWGNLLNLPKLACIMKSEHESVPVVNDNPSRSFRKWT